jgi:carboxymethylenebutenolidase
MCYDSKARPPVPPIAGGAGSVDGHDVVLEAADRNRFGGHAALAPAGPGGPGMVILPDVRGLHDFYRELAVRFAEAGVHAVAIDYFGRTAGIGPRDDDFDWQAHTPQTTPAGIAQDVAAAVTHLRSVEGGGAERIYTVGFCVGGRNSFNQAAEGHNLSGAIGFYGWPTRRDDQDANAPVDRVSRFECPVLGLFGGADRGITPDLAHEFERVLDKAGVRNEIVVYEGAPHSFFDRLMTDHADACDDAWRRIMAFVGPRG